MNGHQKAQNLGRKRGNRLNRLSLCKRKEEGGVTEKKGKEKREGELEKLMIWHPRQKEKEKKGGRVGSHPSL